MALEPPPVRVFYRVVRTDPARARDFTSNRALGKPPRGPELDDPRLHDGLSVSDSLENLRSKARALGMRGYLARLAIPAGAPIRAEKTLGPHHWTLWGAPNAFLACVVYPLERI